MVSAWGGVGVWGSPCLSYINVSEKNYFVASHQLIGGFPNENQLIFIAFFIFMI
jgi:hypothetical protein